jgi:hypothetical protein
MSFFNKICNTKMFVMIISYFNEFDTFCFVVAYPEFEKKLLKYFNCEKKLEGKFINDSNLMQSLITNNKIISLLIMYRGVSFTYIINQFKQNMEATKIWKNQLLAICINYSNVQNIEYLVYELAKVRNFELIYHYADVEIMTEALSIAKFFNDKKATALLLDLIL